jgi:hypothetical protein
MSTCDQCGEPILDEPPGGDPASRKPCPHCGSVTRAFNVHATPSIKLTIPAQLSVTTYPEILLTTAQELFAQAQYGIAIVVAHMACEVAVERVLSRSFGKKDVQYLEDAVMSFLNGYSLSNVRDRKLYFALTGDPIQDQPFWKGYMESATRRNRIIHKGAIADRLGAEASLDAVKALVTHLSQVGQQ